MLAFWNDAATEPSVTDDADGIRVLLDVDPDALLLALDGERVVGTVVASFDGWRGAMYRLAVLPSHRRRGVATALVAEGERRLRMRGARRIHLIVVEDETDATAFWRSVRYECQPQRLRYVKTLQHEEAADG